MGTSHASVVWRGVQDQAHRWCAGTPDSAPHLFLWVPHQKQPWGLPTSSSERAPVGESRVRHLVHPHNTCRPDPPCYTESWSVSVHLLLGVWSPAMPLRGKSQPVQPWASCSPRVTPEEENVKPFLCYLLGKPWKRVLVRQNRLKGMQLLLKGNVFFYWVCMEFLPQKLCPSDFVLSAGFLSWKRAQIQLWDPLVSAVELCLWLQVPAQTHTDTQWQTWPRLPQYFVGYSKGWIHISLL